jgi:hypothetical protein
VSKRHQTVWIVSAVVGLLCLSALIYSWVAGGSFTVCTPQDSNENMVVAINGEDCPATERGLYKVPAGPVMVRVVRTGKPPCVWNGNLEEGRTQEVPCNF